jgi:hypothetical protein
MSLHPDERPQTVAEFRSALLGDWNPTVRPMTPLPEPTLIDLISLSTERKLALISLLLFFISLVVTLIR